MQCVGVPVSESLVVGITPSVFTLRPSHGTHASGTGLRGIYPRLVLSHPLGMAWLLGLVHGTDGHPICASGCLPTACSRAASPRVWLPAQGSKTRLRQPMHVCLPVCLPPHSHACRLQADGEASLLRRGPHPHRLEDARVVNLGQARPGQGRAPCRQEDVERLPEPTGLEARASGGWSRGCEYYATAGSAPVGLPVAQMPIEPLPRRLLSITMVPVINAATLAA